MQNFFPPSFELTGVIKHIDKKEPTAQRKAPAMKLFIQHGPRRMGDATRETNFLNGMFVRVPHFVYQRIADKLVEGRVIQIKGRLQGVHKTAIDSVVTELVAERIAFHPDDEQAHAGPDVDAVGPTAAAPAEPTAE